MAYRLIPKETATPETKRQQPTDQFGNPIGAFARGTAEGLLGTYGSLGQLVGRPPASPLPGQQALFQAEAAATPEQLAGFGTSDISPEYGNLPTIADVNKFLNMLGLPKKEESPAEQGFGRFGRGFGGALAAGVPPGVAASTSFTGAGAAELGKAGGLGETGQSILEILGSLRIPALGPVQQAARIRQPRMVERAIQPRQAGFISPEQLQSQLNRVGQEAADIAGTIGAQHPTFQNISQAIEHGAPIAQRFNQVFEGLEQTARHFNPQLNTQTLDNFLTQEAGRYAQTGAPTELGQFITGEIQGWMQQGGRGLYNLYRRYRLNGERIGEILDSVPRSETLSRTQRQQINFLTRMNDAIRDTFTSNLGTNQPAIPGQGGINQWLNTFTESNRAYSNYLNTRLARRILNPIMQGNVTDRQITGFLADNRNWEDLNRFLGPEETGRLRELLTDTQRARNALNAMPQRDVAAEAMRHGLASLVLRHVPGGKLLSGAISLPRIWQWTRGHYHSRPAFQRNFREMTDAIVERNLPAFKKSIDKLAEEKESEKKPRFKLVQKK